jgi:hypothetical protein
MHDLLPAIGTVSCGWLRCASRAANHFSETPADGHFLLPA